MPPRVEMPAAITLPLIPFDLPRCFAMMMLMLCHADAMIRYDADTVSITRYAA